jgi:anti-sigma-K factor RskA
MTTPGADPRYDALAELALGTLPDGERPELEAWLASDAQAQAELRALQESLALLAVTAPEQEPPADLRARVLAVTGQVANPTGIERPREIVPQSPRPAPAAITRDNAAKGVPLSWLAAAAAALIALGLGWYALQLQSQVEQLEAALQQASAQLAATEAEARAGRARLARAQTETAILAAADLRRVDLAGQKTAPLAAARAFWSRAQGLVFTASRLPELPRGRTYQLWVLTSGAPVSAGLFRPDASGTASMVFDTPVSLPTPAGMAVSVEPEGGVPAPTGDIVLVGKAD